MNKYRILVKGIVQRDNKYLAVEKWYDDNIMEPCISGNLSMERQSLVNHRIKPL